MLTLDVVVAVLSVLRPHRWNVLVVPVSSVVGKVVFSVLFLCDMTRFSRVRLHSIIVIS